MKGHNSEMSVSQLITTRTVRSVCVCVCVCVRHELVWASEMQTEHLV